MVFFNRVELLKQKLPSSLTGNPPIENEKILNPNYKYKYYTGLGYMQTLFTPCKMSNSVPTYPTPKELIGIIPKTKNIPLFLPTTTDSIYVHTYRTYLYVLVYQVGTKLCMNVQAKTFTFKVIICIFSTCSIANCRPLKRAFSHNDIHIQCPV